MDSELDKLDDLVIDLLRRIDQAVKDIVSQQFVDWSALKWHATGPGALFEEFKRAGAWNDSIVSRMLDFEQEKNGIACAFNNLKAQIEERVEAVLKANAKQWVAAGFAYQERQAFARIEVGDCVAKMVHMENRLRDVDNMLAILKAKAAQLTAFKADAKVAASLMSFGNQLGELR